ncbi:FGGY-family carbohydrate kinase [Salipaludibacillus sp. HK11]|uniref:FGGY-family carbohydrate kinase n=1 Tax=Salipaludibacillus sp. HK11 TaxID=3394320 RepID=UPI0039FBFA37
MSLIGLDVGTTGTKAMIIDTDSKILASAYREYKMEFPTVGQYELNPELVWESVKEVLRSCMEQCEHGRDNIKGISVSSLGEAAVFIDKKGEVLANSILYIDNRGAEQLEKLIDAIGEDRIIDKTGLRPHIMYTLPKLMWLIEHNKIDQKLYKLLSFGSFILYRLGSRPVMDYSLASRTMAFNVHKFDWDDEMINSARVRDDIFPELAPAGTIIGEVSPDVANELSLPIDFKLVLGAHDQLCAAIGAGLNKEKQATYGIGSTACISPVFSTNVDVKKLALNNFPLIPYINGQFTTYAFNFTGGSILKWFRDQLGFMEIKEAEKSNRSVYDLLNEKASKCPTGILVLPHFAGSGTPFMNPNSTGAFVGITLNTSKMEIYRGILEGITYEMRYNLDCLENAGIYIDELKVSGGGANSELWLQIMADIMNKKIVALDINETGILGTMILTSVSLGIYNTYDEASEKLFKIRKVYFPQSRNKKVYHQHYQKYKKMYHAVKSVLSEE